MRTLSDIDVKDKRVLMRLDLNVPMKDGEITSDARIVAALPTIKLALEKGAAVMLMAHLGRPTEGEFDREFSLRPVADYLAKLLGMPVPLVADYLETPPLVKPGQVVMLENVRFNVGEKANSPELAEKYASLCDVFVSDGFGVVHRKQASTYGVAEKAPLACAGLLIEQEVNMLNKVLHNPKRPLLAIVGGSKVSTKLMILKSLLQKVDTLIIGGGIANTFLAAQGYNVGSSLYEPDLIEAAQKMLKQAHETGVYIPLPTDVVVSDEFGDNGKTLVKSVDDVAPNEMILDIGPDTADNYSRVVAGMETIIWNGPVGVFEIPAFAKGTETLCNAIAKSAGFSFIGGGDTIAAVHQFHIADKVNYISTGGGSMLEYLEGKTLPGLAVLEH